MNEAAATGRREAMVRTLRAHGIVDERILAAMGKIRRHLFIPAPHRGGDAYGDHPCPIGHCQTISQPFIVAYMTARLQIAGGEKVLEIGAGSGYQAAVLAELGARVFTIERIPELARHAADALRAEGYHGVAIRTGDGTLGWPEEAPFDAIIATCAPAEVPGALMAQLRDGGRMIIPVGDFGAQRLVVVTRQGDRTICHDDLAVRFVPMLQDSP